MTRLEFSIWQGLHLCKDVWIKINLEKNGYSQPTQPLNATPQRK